MGVAKLEKPKKMNFPAKDRARSLYPTFNLTKGEKADGQSVKDLADRVTAHVKAAAQGLGQERKTALIDLIKTYFPDRAKQILSDPMSTATALIDISNSVADPRLKDVAIKSAMELNRVIHASTQTQGLPGYLEGPLIAAAGRLKPLAGLGLSTATVGAGVAKDWMEANELWAAPEFRAAMDLFSSSLSYDRAARALNPNQPDPKAATALLEANDRLKASIKSVNDTASTTPGPSTLRQLSDTASDAYFKTVFPGFTNIMTTAAPYLGWSWNKLTGKPTEGILTTESTVDEPLRVAGQTNLLRMARPSVLKTPVDKLMSPLVTKTLAKVAPSMAPAIAARVSGVAGRAIPVAGTIAGLYTNYRDMMEGLSPAGQQAIDEALKRREWDRLSEDGKPSLMQPLSNVIKQIPAAVKIAPQILGRGAQSLFAGSPEARADVWAGTIEDLEKLAPGTFQGLDPQTKQQLQSAHSARLKYRNEVKAEVVSRFPGIAPEQVEQLVNHVEKTQPILEADIEQRFQNTSDDPAILQHHQQAVRAAALEGAIRQGGHQYYYQPLRTAEYARGDKADLGKVKAALTAVYPEQDLTQLEKEIGAGVHSAEPHSPAKQLGPDSLSELLQFGKVVGPENMAALLTSPVNGGFTPHFDRATTFAGTTRGHALSGDFEKHYALPEELAGQVKQYPATAQAIGLQEARNRQMVRERERKAFENQQMGQNLAKQKADFATRQEAWKADDAARQAASKAYDTQLAGLRAAQQQAHARAQAGVQERLKPIAPNPQLDPMLTYGREDRLPGVATPKPVVTKPVDPSLVKAETKLPQAKL